MAVGWRSLELARLTGRAPPVPKYLGPVFEAQSRAPAASSIHPKIIPLLYCTHTAASNTFNMGGLNLEVFKVGSQALRVLSTPP